MSTQKTVAASLANMTKEALVSALEQRLGRKVARSSLTKEVALRRLRQLRRDEGKIKAPSKGTVRAEAERLLKTDRPYSEVLESLKRKFPDANTSEASLRWYAVQMRKRGETIPERPRAMRH